MKTRPCAPLASYSSSLPLPSLTRRRTALVSCFWQLLLAFGVLLAFNSGAVTDLAASALGTPSFRGGYQGGASGYRHHGPDALRHEWGAEEVADEEDDEPPEVIIEGAEASFHMSR